MMMPVTHSSSFRGAPPISGLPEIGDPNPKSAKADLGGASPESKWTSVWIPGPPP